MSGVRLPTIETARLILRDWTPEDAPAIALLLNDEHISMMTSGVPHPYTLERAEQFIADLAGWHEAGTHRVFAMTLKASGVLVGEIGIWDIDAANRRGKIGAILGRAHWGRGYGTEATAAVIEDAFTRTNLNRIGTECYADNPASARVLEKCGFVPEGRIREKVRREDRWVDDLLYGLLRSDWEQRNSAIH